MILCIFYINFEAISISLTSFVYFRCIVPTFNRRVTGLRIGLLVILLIACLKNFFHYLQFFSAENE